MLYKATIIITHEDSCRLQEMLDRPEQSYKEDEMGVYKTYEHYITNGEGRFIELTVSVGQFRAYVDMTLYDADGYIIEQSDGSCDILIGEHVLENSKETYIIEIKEED